MTEAQERYREQLINSITGEFFSLEYIKSCKEACKKAYELGYAIGYAEGYAIGIAEGEMSVKLTLASEFLEDNSKFIENYSELLEYNSLEFAAKSFELPIEYVQALEDGCTVESIIEKHFEFDI